MLKVIQKVDDYIDLISMKNDDLEIVVSNYGCTIVKVLMKDKHGHIDDVVLGYDDFSSYQTLDAYLGALVGRVANRIGKGQFTLNGQDYHLAINNGPNHLHGGIKGFSYRVFDYEFENENTIHFHYISVDQEEGYPGTLNLHVRYPLDKDTLTIHYQATTDQDTLINLTNHSYFNLSGKQENIYNHQLTVHASSFACVDQDYDQLQLGKGFDHPFIFNQKENQVTLEHVSSGRRLTVSTTLPTAQIYTANYLDGRLGKYGQHYNERDAVCIETQNLPDAIHIEKNPSTILRKGEQYDEITSYRFEVIK